MGIRTTHLPPTDPIKVFTPYSYSYSNWANDHFFQSTLNALKEDCDNDEMMLFDYVASLRRLGPHDQPQKRKKLRILSILGVQYNCILIKKMAITNRKRYTCLNFAIQVMFWDIMCIFFGTQCTYFCSKLYFMHITI